MSARRSRHLHLMADYGAAGVWGTPLDPTKLPLSPKLKARLARWCSRFQKSFETEIDLDAFAAESHHSRKSANARQRRQPTAQVGTATN